MINLDRLEKLANLHNQHILSDSEFIQLKNEILNDTASNQNIHKHSLKYIWNCFVQAITEDYANFNGKTNKHDFWSFTLFNIMFSFIPFVNLFWYLFGCIPTIAINIRRAHDVGLTGWQFYQNLCVGLVIAFILLIPSIGNPSALIFCILIAFAFNLLVIIKMISVLLKPSQSENDNNQQSISSNEISGKSSNSKTDKFVLICLVLFFAFALMMFIGSATL